MLAERSGPWCHTKHVCHHWFERECSEECDRGEHDGPHGHEGCTDKRPAVVRIEVI